MGKLSDADWHEMSGRLRARAARLMRQLDAGAGYREQIERDLAKRLGATAAGRRRGAPSRATSARRARTANDAGRAVLQELRARSCDATTDTAQDTAGRRGAKLRRSRWLRLCPRASSCAWSSTRRIGAVRRCPTRSRCRASRGRSTICRTGTVSVRADSRRSCRTTSPNQPGRAARRRRRSLTVEDRRRRAARSSTSCRRARTVKARRGRRRRAARVAGVPGAGAGRHPPDARRDRQGEGAPAPQRRARRPSPGRSSLGGESRIVIEPGDEVVAGVLPARHRQHRARAGEPADAVRVRPADRRRRARRCWRARRRRRASSGTQRHASTARSRRARHARAGRLRSCRAERRSLDVAQTFPAHARAAGRDREEGRRHEADRRRSSTQQQDMPAEGEIVHRRRRAARSPAGQPLDADAVAACRTTARRRAWIALVARRRDRRSSASGPRARPRRRGRARGRAQAARSRAARSCSPISCASSTTTAAAAVDDAPLRGAPRGARRRARARLRRARQRRRRARTRPDRAGVAA